MITRSDQVEFVTIFATVHNTDGNEGRGRNVDHQYFLTHSDAMIGADGIDVMGSDGKVEARDAIRRPDGSYFLIKKVVITDPTGPERLAAIRRVAIKKLSAIERIALGVE